MKNREAFTLIEMLIVIVIVTILAFMAINSYGIAKRKAQVDIAADSLVSAIKKQQGLAKSGKVVDVTASESERLCYGIHFSVTDPYVEYVEAPYVLLGTDRADYLASVDTNTVEFFPIEELKIVELRNHNDDEDEIVILFKPPFGKGYISTSMNSDPKLVTDEDFFISVSLPNGDDVRSLHFDAAVSLSERVYEEK